MTALDHLPAFVNQFTFNVVVESPRGSALKLKYDPHLGVMSISRPLSAGLVYPYDWGFVPSTKGEDGDPIDALLLWDVASFPGVVIPCRALGVIQVDQKAAEGRGRVRNDRIVAVPVDARRETALKSAVALPKRLRDELENFFLAATALEKKDAKILGWRGPAAALKLLRASDSSR